MMRNFYVTLRVFFWRKLEISLFSPYLLNPFSYSVARIVWPNRFLKINNYLSSFHPPLNHLSTLRNHLQKVIASLRVFWRIVRILRWFEGIWHFWLNVHFGRSSFLICEIGNPLQSIQAYLHHQIQNYPKLHKWRENWKRRNRPTGRTRRQKLKTHKKTINC